MKRQGPAEASLTALQEQVRAAVASRTSLRIVGGDTKRRLRGDSSASLLRLSGYRGIVDYTPAELVIVARAGTPLEEIEEALSERGQRLAFEPPRTGPGATVGGMLGAGIAGPSRPWTAAVRDHVLGVTLVNHEGALVRFGGQVMKNVAGYDVPRLVAGAWGRLGPVVEVALRVVPVPAVSRCFAWASSLEEARTWGRRAGQKPWPVTGLCHDGETLRLRLEGAGAAVDAAAAALPAGSHEESADFFSRLRDWQLEFFQREDSLWRCVLPANAEPSKLEAHMLWDWAGGLRWVRTNAAAEEFERGMRARGGSARPFDQSFAGCVPSQAVQQALEARLRTAFDPSGVYACNAGPVGA